MRHDAPLASASGGTAALLRVAWSHRIDSTAWLSAALLMVAYCVVFVRLSPLPLQDLPTHLARAVITSDLVFHGGTRFASDYQYQFLPIPYVLGDLILAFAVEMLGPTAASALWTVLVFLSLPCALLFYLSMTGVARNRRAVLLIISLYLATDSFFIRGFMSYRLGLAMTLATLALVHRLRDRSSFVLFAAYGAAVVLDYLMHLSTVAFLSAGVAAGGTVRLCRRTTRLRTEVWLALPLAAVLLRNFAVADAYRAPTDLIENGYTWGPTLYDKLARLGNPFLRYQRSSDQSLFVAAVLCAVLLAVPLRWDRLRSPKVLEPLALALAFLALYFILPKAYSDAWLVDARALPFVTLFLLIACARLGEHSPAVNTRAVGILLLAAVLAIGNLASLYPSLDFFRERITLYRAVVAAVPLHARVLPVFNSGPYGMLPLLHANSFLSIDRSALMPYEFAGDNGNIVRYFRYVRRPYDPPENWAGHPPRMALDWNAIACEYEYLLLTLPFSFDRIPLPTVTVAHNQIAALLSIDPQACPQRRTLNRSGPVTKEASR
jgi:hypothetical protein